MKKLNGSELASYIKERHVRQVAALRRQKTIPRLAIVQVKDDPAINTYVTRKQEYGADIGTDVEVHKITQDQITQVIKTANHDPKVHGIIVQLPLSDVSKTEEILNLVSPSKDVDGLGSRAQFEPATPNAILWLLAGYNVDLKDKQILIIGRGKLVGVPLAKILVKSGLFVNVADEHTKNLAEKTKAADIIVTATGSPGLIKSDMVKTGAVVVDAGVASEEGKTVGDVSPELYRREDLILTPQRGGVGPLTVCALFENLIRAASENRSF